MDRIWWNHFPSWYGSILLCPSLFILLLCGFKYVLRCAYPQTHKHYVLLIVRIPAAKQVKQRQEILIISIHTASIRLAVFIFLYPYHVLQTMTSNLKLRHLQQSTSLWPLPLRTLINPLVLQSDPASCNLCPGQLAPQTHQLLGLNSITNMILFAHTLAIRSSPNRFLTSIPLPIWLFPLILEIQSSLNRFYPQCVWLRTLLGLDIRTYLPGPNFKATFLFITHHT